MDDSIRHFEKSLNSTLPRAFEAMRRWAKILEVLKRTPIGGDNHSLLIPKFHFPSLQDTPPTVIAALCSIVPFLTGAIVTATQSDSFNLLVNKWNSSRPSNIS
ncbi:hypothetical protein HPP92_007383, partial [Vanilla planifolia]